MYKSWMWKQRSYCEQFQGDEGNGSAGGAAQPEGEAESTNGETQAEPAKTETVDASGATEPADGDDEVVITLGDEPPAPEGEGEQQGQAAPEWVKRLRKEARETAKENRELKARLEAAAAPKVEQAQPKPTLADCDYDEEAFETKLTAWHEQQRTVKAKQAAEAEAQAKQQQEWEGKRSAYDSAKAALKVANFDDAEDTLKEAFSSTQQAVLLEAVDSAATQAQLVYVLGNNPAELKRLSAITNPIKFAVAIAALEGKLKVTTVKRPPAPEKVISGRTTAVGVQDTKLARLEAEADRTGIRTELIRYKAELKRAQGN